MIAIVNPPNPCGAVSNKDTMGGLGQLYHAGTSHGFPPLDMLYAAAVLRSRGIPFQILESLGHKLDVTELIIRLEQQKPGVVAIRTSLPTFDWDMKIAQIVKWVLAAKILIFGPYATLNASRILQNPFVDALVLGEPELTLAEVAAVGGLEKCEGLWLKEPDGVTGYREREPVSDLDMLPFPAWDLVPYREYDGSELMRNKRPFVTILTSRGCPHGCFYCPYPVTQGRKLRVRSPENVVEELAWLKASLGVEAVLFRDPEFAFYRDRVTAICEGILKKGIRLCWRCETRIEDLDEEIIRLMARAGCIGINMGIESADESVLKSLRRKPVSLQKAQSVIRACRENDIQSFCFFILGLPGESREAALRTVRLALKLNPAFLQFTVATPYPGTDLSAWAEENGFIENHALSSMTSYETVMRNEHMSSSEIRSLQWLAQEAREMTSRRIADRLLRSIRQVGREAKRWVNFQQAKKSSGIGLWESLG